MKKIKSDMPIGKLTKVEDFLPSPDKLVIQDNSVKITLRISKSSMEFFKDHAKKYHTKYQKMIRLLLDKYTEKYHLQH
jgi:predicted DNA binding CopG/RHH family protein